jgi:hypothetical protein
MFLYLAAHFATGGLVQAERPKIFSEPPAFILTVPESLFTM